MIVNSDVIWVADNQQLAELAQQWLQCEQIAIDTEFVREKTFYPIPGLIQVADINRVYLIDPLAIDDWSPLAQVLAEPGVTKIIHACREDIELLYLLTAAVPQAVVDSQLAAAFIGLGYSLGYQALIEKVLGIKLDKGATRSDWLQRPLSDVQLDYAAADVHYLIAAYAQIEQSLLEQNRDDWLRTETAQLVAETVSTPADENYYQKVKNAWRLPSVALGRLQKLCHWRETKARQRNIPRNWLVDNNALCAIAKINPSNARELKQLPGLKKPVSEKWFKEILQLLADNTADSSAALLPLPGPLSGEQQALSKQLKQRLNQQAEALGLAPELMINKASLQAFIRDGAAALDIYTGTWREQGVVPILLLQHSLDSK